MIVRKHFRPHKVIYYIWKELALATIASTAVLIVGTKLHPTWLQLNYAPFAALGTALSIFLGFRTNSAYARWNQASQAWASLRNSSRVFVRLVKTVSHGHANGPNYNKKATDNFIREVGRRQIACVHAIRLSLREQDDWQSLAQYITKQDYAGLQAAENKPAYLIARQGESIYDALQQGILQGFDSFQMETQLSAFANAFATVEQLKETTMPRPYGFFTHLFVQIYILIAPLFLFALFAVAHAAWMIIPMTLLIAFLLAPIDSLGNLIERPFENDVNDVPISAASRNTERDILEILGETNLPAKPQPVNGYLF